MANIKETPRQKMIGLVYLVLVAMLALQVDNTLLDKFIWIDESLQKTLRKTVDDNLQLLHSLREAIKSRGNQDQGMALLDKAEQVKSATALVLTEIKDMRASLVRVTGGVDEEGQPKGAMAVDPVMAYALGPGDAKTGKAYQLKRILANYVAEVNRVVPGFGQGPIALDADQIGRYRGTDQENKDFAELNFQNTPTVAALAILSELSTQVADVEARALDKLYDEVGADEIPLDKIVAKVSPESRIVTAGTPYRAKMYIAAASSAANPEMSSDVGAVAVNADGEGEVSFTASAGNYDASGFAKKVWRGQITLKTPRGDTTFYVEEEYIVARPTLKFESAAIKALYKNCGNVLNVEIPGMGPNLNPTFRASGGAVVRGNRPGQLTAIPNGRSMQITVANQGAVMGTEKFRVKPIPRPSVKFYGSGNRALSEKNGGRIPSQIRVKAIADADFAQFLPNDAKYRVTKWEVALARAAATPYGRKTFTSSRGNIRSFAERARKGDRLVIEIKEVVRTNFKGVKERVDLGEDKYFFYPITQ